MNLDTRQDTGKVQWRWTTASGCKWFSYSEHLLNNGLSMLYFLDKPNSVIVHVNHDSHSSDLEMSSFINRAFSIIGLEVELLGRDIDVVRFEHEYTDFVYEIKVLDRQGIY